MNVVEPLVESCDWLSCVAEFACAADGEIAWSQDRSSADQDTSCAWYHGTWQYLRLLGLVSNPANHSGFYGNALRATAGHLSTPDVVICGAADYSMLAHVCAALGPAVRPVVLELCRTPLIANDWYAVRCGAPRPKLVQADACRDLPAERFDVVVTDSFMPRIEHSTLVPMLATWRAALRPSGAVITTVRIADPGEDNRQQFIDLFSETVRQAASWLPTVTHRPIADLITRAGDWVRRQETTSFFSVDEVAGLFTQAGFDKVDSAERVIRRKRYAEVVATR